MKTKFFLMLIFQLISFNLGHAQFDCEGKTYSLSATTGEIRAFSNPLTSAALGTVINTTPHPATPTGTNGPNALGYSNATGKFYYVQVQGTASTNNTFVSYDPTTNTYATLAGTTGTIFRGTATNDGLGYYAITSTNVLKYYSITNNTWATIASNYVNQNGVSLNTLLNDNAGGDIAMDGNGNLWILAGGNGSPTAYVFRVKSAVPQTSMGSTPLVLEQVLKQNMGENPNGISFNSAGELYISNGTKLFRMNNNFTVSEIGNISPMGGQGDLASCAYPLNPFAISDFGDAPDSYKTLLSSNGPRHTASQYDATNNTASLMIGNAIDLEFDAYPNTGANGDDNNNINDENSVVFPALTTATNTYTITVPVVNSTGTGATLRGWIDFNRNGTFDASEAVSVAVPNGATNAILSWSGLSGLSAGETYYRLRIAKNNADIILPTGSVFGGEVEDGRITITNANGCPVVMANLTPYNNGTAKSEAVFANNNISIGNNRLSLTHTTTLAASLFTPNRISDDHYNGETGIQTGHNQSSGLPESQKIVSTLSFNTPISLLSFTLSDIDYGDRVKVNAYDENNSLITLTPANYSIYNPANIGVSGNSFYDAQYPVVFEAASGTREGTVNVNFHGKKVSRVVFEFTDDAMQGAYTISKIAGEYCAVCYEDPTLVTGATYPAKHGITTLGRAGKTSSGTNNTASDWPMNKNSAYTVLESKSKGFVITRMTSDPAQSSAINHINKITNPVVGMMVFDTFADSGKGCLKIYTGPGTGEGWKCFNTQGCP